ncbi:hypothetical protein J1N35_014639 [Gossypium stocksii]|uniref:Uncharacterized protein n=1 Tax=Gossypium stocksii TaxID=47602 RepID=A0A9D3VVI9_9ROSI|nr:hypothetical protein J1N35_014639 [Gossypium stocksii]
MELVVEPLELLLGPITQARAKRFQEALSSYIDRAWREEVTDHCWTSSPSLICNVLLADIARLSLMELNLA